MHDYFICFIVIVLDKYSINMNTVVVIATVFSIIISFIIYKFCIKNKYLKNIFKPDLRK